jgi:precorrin-6Y C5,15-methyltransferase (decarboxylating)
VQAAMITAEGTVIAVEYDRRDYNTMQCNVEKFGLNNVIIVDSLENGILDKLPVPDKAFIVASPRIGSEIKSLLAINPLMDFIIYTYDFETLTSLPALFQENGLERTEAVLIEVSRVNSKNMIEPFPAPGWSLVDELFECSLHSFIFCWGAMIIALSLIEGVNMCEKKVIIVSSNKAVLAF